MRHKHHAVICQKPSKHQSCVDWNTISQTRSFPQIFGHWTSDDLHQLHIRFWSCFHNLPVEERPGWGMFSVDMLSDLNGKTISRPVVSPLKSSLHSHRFFRKRSSVDGNVELNFAREMRSQSFDENSGRDNLILQEQHLRYLMSSTAEQPDNSSRSSTINIWLTILIAALAAAILS
ncbi:uncharacterized protein TNCV_3286971 [Trichonephila clavipes]|nr:uncharacterized protein TNCV_3286971 [Trichonephila clavipes]